MTGVSLYWMTGDSLHEAQRAMVGLGYRDIKEGERAGRGDIIVVDNEDIVARVLKKAVEGREVYVLDLSSFLILCKQERLVRDQMLPHGGLSNCRVRRLEL